MILYETSNFFDMARSLYELLFAMTYYSLVIYEIFPNTLTEHSFAEATLVVPSL